MNFRTNTPAEFVLHRLAWDDVLVPEAPRRRDSAADLPGRRLGNRYRLDRVIGRGSMGTVWAATDDVLHRQVAIKQIDYPPGMPDDEIDQLERRTLREARAIAALSNPYVITLFDILTLPSGPVIVMELLRARSLADIIKQVGRLPDGQAATVGVAVASGLLAAHAAGITHRDVKPGNVLICDDGRIKLTDFGIARAEGEQTMTATGLLLGSPAYIAPEVASGTPAGPISDAWGLGGLLFACMEGRPPFDQGTAIATLTSVVKDPVPPHPHSGRLGAVVSGLLVKTPTLRMRIDRALVIMRSIADDPAGMHLSLVDRLASPPTGSGPRPTNTQGSAAPRSQPIQPTPPPPPRPAATLLPPSPTGAGYPAPHPRPTASALPAASSAPPPPWAGQDSAALRPLPAAAPPATPDRRRWLAAVLVALLAAVAGFFGVRAIAAAADGQGAAPPSAAVVDAAG